MLNTTLTANRMYIGGAIAALAAAVALPAGAQAGLVNIGDGASGSNPTGITATITEPNRISDGTAMSVALNGSGSVTSDILLALLLPNNGGASATTAYFGSHDPISSATLYTAFPALTPATSVTTSLTGTGFNLGTGSANYLGNGYWGEFIGTTGQTKLAGFLGTAFHNSLNGASFSGFDSTTLGLTGITGFGVYTIDLKTGPFSPSGEIKPIVDLTLPAGLPLGSIVVAYTDAGNSVIWSNAGGTNLPPPEVVPEPATLGLYALTGSLALLVRGKRTGHELKLRCISKL